MKNIAILSILVVSQWAVAGVNSLSIPAKVYSFDLKTVTLEILGEKYKFDRKKLGPEYKKLQAGEIFEIYLDKNDLKELKK